MEAPRPKTVPSNIAVQMVKQHHETIHLGKTALKILLSCYDFVPKLPTLCAQISARCVTCAQNNDNQGPRPRSNQDQTRGADSWYTAI